MSRTTTCLIAAAALVAASLAVATTRRQTMIGDTSTSQARFFAAASPQRLAETERHLVETLLLLPVAALVICVAQNVVGLTSFGTFTPALLGLAFREPRSWPGALVFLGLVLAGWLLRRAVDRFYLLQAPRVSLMLTAVIAALVGLILIVDQLGGTATQSVSLFPLVILTGMIERFWTLDEEDGARAAFRRLAVTGAIAACVALIVGRAWLAEWLMAYPELLGIVAAGQMMLGRYTGFRLTELYRFREFLRDPAEDVEASWADVPIGTMKLR